MTYSFLISMNNVPFKEQLISRVSEQGRQAYADTVDSVPDVVGLEAEIMDLALRIIKGAQRYHMERAMLTPEGLATEDGEIVDCSAAMVINNKGVWERYVGKNSKHSRRLLTTYKPETRKIVLWSEGTSPKEFDSSILLPREGEIVTAKFGNEILEGVLEKDELTAHIRDCLRQFESKVENIGILLRHPSFKRLSDTRTPGDPDIRTLYTDGSQIHFINNDTVDHQNQTIARKMSSNHYRPGVTASGLPPNSEDRIYGMRFETVNMPEPAYVNLTSLTPRCPDPQRDLVTGEMNAEPKLWNGIYRPTLAPDGNTTMGANTDVDPGSYGAVIKVGSRVIVDSEKTEWRQ